MSDQVPFNRRAFIVDQDAPLRAMIRQMLTRSGIYTEEFGTAEAYFDDVERRPIGCLILDIKLPGISGLELLRRLKAARIQSPVIILSGQSDVMIAVDAVKQGAFDYVQKPFRDDELMSVVDTAFHLIQAMPASAGARFGALSPREREALSAFAGGASNKAVAAKLGLSVRTVEMHRAKMLKKLGVQNLTQALLHAQQQPPRHGTEL